MEAPSVDMKDVLESSSVALGTFGTDLFVGTMPPDPDDNITLRDTPWRPSELNYELEMPGIQILIRGKKGTYNDVYTKAKAVHTALHGYQDTINGARYLVVAAAHTPFYVGEDKSSRPLFSINFEVQRTTA